MNADFFASMARLMPGVVIDIRYTDRDCRFSIGVVLNGERIDELSLYNVDELEDGCAEVLSRATANNVKSWRDQDIMMAIYKMYPHHGIMFNSLGTEGWWARCTGVSYFAYSVPANEKTIADTTGATMHEALVNLYLKLRQKEAQS